MKYDKLSLKINISYLISIILFLPFFYPSFLRRFSYLKHVYKYGQIISIAVCLLIIILKVKNKDFKISKINWLILALFIELLGVTFIYVGNVDNLILYVTPTVLGCLLLDNVQQKNFKYIIKGISDITFVFMIINLISIILYPKGLYQGTQSTETYYFLGHNNAQIRWLIPGIVFRGVYDLLCYKKFSFKMYIMCICTFLTVSLTWSNVSMVGIFIILIYIMFFKKWRFKFLLNSKFVFLLPIVLFCIAFSFNTFEGLFGYIGNLFGKDATLTGRTEIWQAGLKAIKEHWLFGYGYSESITKVVDWRKGIEISSFHNYFFDLLYRGGLVQLILQVLIIGQAVKCLFFENNTLNNYLKICLISYFVMWTALPFNGSDSWTLMFIFVICCYINNTGVNGKEGEICE